MTDLLDNDADDVSLEAVLERFLDDREEELHTALPGRVVSYDAAAQTADVRPLIRRRIQATDGTFRAEPMPIIRAVPVLVLRWGSFFIHARLEAGDDVLLVIAERDFARWRVTGAESDPIDTRLHHLSHAIAIPGMFSRAAALSGSDTPSGALVLGAQGGAQVRIEEASGEVKLGTAPTAFVALANLVDAEFARVKATLDSLSGASFTVPYAAPLPTGASKTRAE